MIAVAAWPTLPADQLPRDPWPHEHGEDPGHLLDPAGHARHHADEMAWLVGQPERFVYRERQETSPAATYLISSEVLAFVVVALLAVSASLPGMTG